MGGCAVRLGPHTSACVLDLEVEWITYMHNHMSTQNAYCCKTLWCSTLTLYTKSHYKSIPTRSIATKVLYRNPQGYITVKTLSSVWSLVGEVG